MAKVTENDITRGISGAVTRGLIFRKNNDQRAKKGIASLLMLKAKGY